MEIVLIFMVIGAVIGGLIGQKRNQAASGVVWGALLGPIGWLLVAVMPDHRAKCPACRNALIPGARRCLCGFDLVVKIPEAQPKVPDILILGTEQAEGPFTASDILDRITVGELPPDVLCAPVGCSEWIPFNQLRAGRSLRNK